MAFHETYSGQESSDYLSAEFATMKDNAEEVRNSREDPGIVSVDNVFGNPEVIHVSDFCK
jgi:hypothetical protein